jgi:hypothetical protein
VFSDWITDDDPEFWKASNMTSPDRMQGQIDVMNQRISQTTEAIVEIGKVSLQAREAMHSDMKQSLMRVHERIDALFHEMKELRNIHGEIQALKMQVSHHDWLLKMALGSGIGGLCAALWSLISHRLN